MEANSNRKDFTRGGYRFVGCECGERFNAGRPGNAAGNRYVAAYKDEWWLRHTGQPLGEGMTSLKNEKIPFCRLVIVNIMRQERPDEISEE